MLYIIVIGHPLPILVRRFRLFCHLLPHRLCSESVLRNNFTKVPASQTNACSFTMEKLWALIFKGVYSGLPLPIWRISLGETPSEPPLSALLIAMNCNVQKMFKKVTPFIYRLKSVAFWLRFCKTGLVTLGATFGQNDNELFSCQIP